MNRKLTLIMAGLFFVNGYCLADNGGPEAVHSGQTPSPSHPIVASPGFPEQGGPNQWIQDAKGCAQFAIANGGLPFFYIHSPSQTDANPNPPAFCVNVNNDNHCNSPGAQWWTGQKRATEGRVNYWAKWDNYVNLTKGTHAAISVRATLPSGELCTQNFTIERGNDDQYKVAATNAPTAVYANNMAAQQPAVQPMGDPYGFLNWLNQTRASYGLPAVGYDQNLSNWAGKNNEDQVAKGMGHFVMGPARRQNSAWAPSGFWSQANNLAKTVPQQWMDSPLHRAALLDPTITSIGLAGLGAYWTFNAY
jgi:hypothetical protein